MLTFQFLKESDEKITKYLKSFHDRTESNVFSEIYFDENNESWHSLGALETAKRNELKTKNITIYALSEDNYLEFIHQFKPETSLEGEFVTLFEQAKEKAYQQLRHDAGKLGKTNIIVATKKLGDVKDNVKKKSDFLRRENKQLRLDIKENRDKQSHFEFRIANQERLLAQSNSQIALTETDIFISEQRKKPVSNETNDDLEREQLRIKKILTDLREELNQYIQWLEKTINDLRNIKDFREIFLLNETLAAAQEKLKIIEAQINVVSVYLNKKSLFSIFAVPGVASVFFITGIHEAWLSEASKNIIALAMTRPDVVSVLAGFATNVTMSAFFSYAAAKAYEILARKKIESSEKRPATEEKKLIKRDAKNFGYLMFSGITGYCLGAAAVKCIFLACNLHPVGLLFTLIASAAAGLASAAGACLTFWHTEKKKFLDENGKLKEKEWEEHKKTFKFTKKLILTGISTFISGFAATMINVYVPKIFNPAISKVAKILVNTLIATCISAINAFTCFYFSFSGKKTKQAETKDQNTPSLPSQEYKKSSDITLTKILSGLFSASKKPATQPLSPSTPKNHNVQT